MTEPSTKARELVDGVVGRAKNVSDNPSASYHRLEALEDARDALLTYIADLERRAHPEPTVEGDKGIRTPEEIHAAMVVAAECLEGFDPDNEPAKDLRAAARRLRESPEGECLHENIKPFESPCPDCGARIYWPTKGTPR